MLGLQKGNLDRKKLSDAFQSTNCYKWLSEILAKSDSLRFGAVTLLLHDAILDDPKPYRKDVKSFVSNLFRWFELLENFEITTPRYTEVIKRIPD